MPRRVTVLFSRAGLRAPQQARVLGTAGLRFENTLQQGRPQRTLASIWPELQAPGLAAVLGLLCLIALFCATACRREQPASDSVLLVITLPGGQQVQAEVLTRPEDMARGMMFRDSLPAGRGMLFVHQTPGRYTYWMYQCLIPLDIIWLDSSKRIVEIVENVPPCRSDPQHCPHYGGHYESQYVLELAGGMARRYGLKIGDRLVF